MSTPQVLVIVGGISKGSLNEKVYQVIKAKHSTEFNFQEFDIKSLPFFSQDLEADPPESVKQLRAQIKKSDAVLFITPEYNRSFPGVLKNALDWGSRPYGQNSWDKKPAGVIGASVGNIGTFGAQHHLRQVLAYLNMPTLGQPEVYLNAGKAFDAQGNLTDSVVEDILAKYLKAFKAWALLHAINN